MSVLTAGTRRDPEVSRHRLLAALLAISVALNLCVVAGALWSRYSAPSAPSATERLRNMATTLNLDDQQRAAFEAYVAATRTRQAALRQALEPLLDSAWLELGKPQPDEAAILQRLSDASARWRASQQETVDATIALLATLNPDQRDRFVAAERERRAALRRRHAEENR